MTRKVPLDWNHPKSVFVGEASSQPAGPRPRPVDAAVRAAVAPRGATANVVPLRWNHPNIVFVGDANGRGALDGLRMA